MSIAMAHCYQRLPCCLAWNKRGCADGMGSRGFPYSVCWRIRGRPPLGSWLCYTALPVKAACVLRDLGDRMIPQPPVAHHWAISLLVCFLACSLCLLCSALLCRALLALLAGALVSLWLCCALLAQLCSAPIILSPQTGYIL